MLLNRKYLALAIILILLLAAGLRIWGIEWGLPTSKHYFSYHPDENVVLLASTNINFFDNQFDPGFYNYGSLYLYLLSFAILLASGWGFVNLPRGDIFSNIGEFAKLYMCGRVVAVLLGILTIYLVYALGRRAYGKGTGVLAALFMAVLPLHLMHSKFLAVDVPATFFVTLALIFAVRIPMGHRLRDYLLAGLFAGLAAGTKYNAGLVILAPIIAHLASGKSKTLIRLVSPKMLTIPITAAIGFLIGTPGVILNTEAFKRDFLYELRHAGTGHGLLFTDTGSGYLYHLTHSLWAGMGLPLLVLSLIGLLYALRKRTSADLAFLVFVIAYFGVIGAAEVRFSRYVMPLLPVMAVFAARVSVDSVGRLVTGKRWIRPLGYAESLIVALVFGYTLLYSISIDRVFASTDTRDRAAAWVAHNIPHGSSIGLPTIPWFYTPPLDPYFGLLDANDRYKRTQEPTDYILMLSKDKEWNVDFLSQELPDAVIISEFESRDRLRLGDSSTKEYFAVLDREYRLAHKFANPPSLFGIRLPLMGKLPHDMSYASPAILIYERR